MTFNCGAGKDFLSFYLDPELLNEEEAKNWLGEAGINLESAEQKFKNCEKKIDALLLKVNNSVEDEEASDKESSECKLCTV